MTNNLKKLLSLGLISFGLVSGGGVVYWNIDLLKSYCVDYAGEECVEEKTGYELVSQLRNEGVTQIDAYCAGEGEMPDPKFILLYKLAINNGLTIESGQYDLDQMISDGHGFVYCNENDYFEARDYMFSKVVDNYDPETKMTSLDTKEDKDLFDSLLVYEINKRGGINNVQFSQPINPENSESLIELVNILKNG